MPPLLDVYVLAPERTQAMVERFLDHFLPDREPSGNEYWVRLGDVYPVVEFDHPLDMARYCEAHPETEARAYWHATSPGDVHSAHVFFLPGGLVLGLSVWTYEPSLFRVVGDGWLEQVRSFARAEHGYWTHECPPEDTVAEFIAVSRYAKSERGR